MIRSKTVRIELSKSMHTLYERAIETSGENLASLKLPVVVKGRGNQTYLGVHILCQKGLLDRRPKNTTSTPSRAMGSTVHRTMSHS